MGTCRLKSVIHKSCFQEEPDAGFSLLETLIAFAILSLTMLIAAQTISQASLKLQKSQELFEVISLVNEIRSSNIIDAERYVDADDKNTFFQKNNVSINKDGILWRIEFRDRANNSLTHNFTVLPVSAKFSK